MSAATSSFEQSDGAFRGMEKSVDNSFSVPSSMQDDDDGEGDQMTFDGCNMVSS